ncbi:AraC family transcriptional regulator [Paenibacillus mucilaginosus]|nr:AraC family transcriptional regulator [Paenibacillus mucilaginosus]AEI43275.1 transcriptional regulator, AraC family [Paenibacillus mucilaginosus KNP414]MCG7212170.1 AraC family transcriptional regulator [Paenibacillus mucilaginosus]
MQTLPGVMIMTGRIGHLSGDMFFEEDLEIFVNRELESFTLSQHTHDFIEICYVGEGCGYHYIEDRVLPVKQGDLFLIPLGTSHVFRPSSPTQDKMLVIYNCIFRSSLLDRWKGLLQEHSRTYHAVYDPAGLSEPWLHIQDKYDTFQTLIGSMHSEYLKRSTGFETVLTALLVQMLVMLQRFEQQSEAEPVPSRMLEEVVHFIKSNYTQNITVQHVADYFFLSASHFQRLFKKSTGFSFTQYLQNVRIQKCCELLKTTDIPIYQIANQVGYQDMKFFHALFRKKTGVTPRQYRQNFQEIEENAISL